MSECKCDARWSGNDEARYCAAGCPECTCPKPSETEEKYGTDKYGVIFDPDESLPAKLSEDEPSSSEKERWPHLSELASKKEGFKIINTCFKLSRDGGEFKCERETLVVAYDKLQQELSELREHASAKSQQLNAELISARREVEAVIKERDYHAKNARKFEDELKIWIKHRNIRVMRDKIANLEARSAELLSALEKIEKVTNIFSDKNTNSEIEIIAGEAIKKHNSGKGG